MINILKVVVQFTVVVFLLEVVGKAFLKHTLIGRFIITLFKDTFKASRYCVKGGKKVSKVLLKEAKAICKTSTTKVKAYAKTRKANLTEQVKEDKVVNGENVLNLADYLQKQKVK